MPDEKENPFDLAGERMTVEQSIDGNQIKTTITFDDKGTGRMCGRCTLCCKLLPVPSIQKAAGEKCQHSKAGKGCTIYATRPIACRTWSCRWLSDRETAGMPRPDRCHYVIDIELDHVRSTLPDEPSESSITFDVIQVWVDPAFPDAHRAPELRAYMLHMAQAYGLATIVRFDSQRAIVVFPPPFDANGQWHEIQSNLMILARNDLERKILADFAASQPPEKETPT